MKRKSFWVLLAILVCGALAQLAVSASPSEREFTPKELDKFKDDIKAKRRDLATWLNDSTGDTSAIIHENAVTVNQANKVVGRGRARVEGKWKDLRKHHGDRRVRFETTEIRFVPADFMTPGEGANWTKHNCIAVEFGTYTFLSGPEAESGPSALRLQPDGGEYWAIWGHKEDCPWGIIVEIEY